MGKSFYQKVIDLIPSRDLKDCVHSCDFRFGEKDLLKIITDYSYDFNKKISLLEEAAQTLSDRDMRALAKKRIAFEKRNYEAFMRADSDTVYETKIKISPRDADDETYLTSTFDDAVKLIGMFLKCYEIRAAERVNARYTINKKTVGVPNKPNDIYKDKVGTIGTCVLDQKLKIIDLDMYNIQSCEVTCKKGLCDECMRCIGSAETRFPHFIKPYDLVAYYDDLIYDPTHLTYGIFDYDMGECDTDSHVVLLENNEYIQRRNVEFRDENGYYRVYDAHCHPSCFEIVKPDVASVPQSVRDDYEYAVVGLKKINGEQ